MTNEEICLKIQRGDSSLTETLWLQLERLVDVRAQRFYYQYRDRCTEVGITVDDLHQVGYFALIKALQYFDSNRGIKFSTCFCVYLKGEFFHLAKMHSTDWHKNSAEKSTSLDAPIFDENSIALIDTLVDKQTESAYVRACERIDVSRALEQIPDRQRKVLTDIYILGFRPIDLARRAGVTRATINGLRIRAIKACAKTIELSNYKV